MGFVPLPIVKLSAFEVPPTGAGFVTVTAGLPAAAIAPPGMAAVNCVELTNVVVTDVPPKATTEAATKFAPVIVSVKAEPPAAALFGEIVAIAGIGVDPLDGGLLTVEAVLPPHPARIESTDDSENPGPMISAILLYMATSLA
jgi:hypothetical protein